MGTSYLRPPEGSGERPRSGATTSAAARADALSQPGVHSRSSSPGGCFPESSRGQVPGSAPPPGCPPGAPALFAPSTWFLSALPGSVRAAVIAAGCASLFLRQPMARGHLLCWALSEDAFCAPSASRSLPWRTRLCAKEPHLSCRVALQKPLGLRQPLLPKLSQHHHANGAMAASCSPPQTMCILTLCGTAPQLYASPLCSRSPNTFQP